MPTTDDRVVQMTFKNEQFERGVKESLQSLEQLKKALELDKSAESLSNLERIASSFDISGIAKGIEDIASRFTLVGNIGQEAFRRISSFALDEVHKVTSAITSMPQIGMGKYEQKNKSIQMIQSAMPEKSIEEIEAVLAKLNEYTDLTSYDFSAMANSIGKFVSAGVDLDVAETAMEGIANEVASAGGEISQANIAMYNFSQALATGSVKLMDWRSIENQNLATKEFKEQIIETAYELGTLGKVQDKVGVTTKGNTVNFENFAQTLNEGWFTSDVLIKVLEKYANREEGVGKKGFEAAKIAITLSQALDAVKDAVSTGWMESFGYLFGNLEEAGDLFTRISDAIIGFTDQISEFRNSILKGWHDGGEDGISGYQKVIEGLSNTWAILMGIVESAKSAFKEIFGELDASGLIEASKAFADFTGNLRELFGYSEEIKTWTTTIKKPFKAMEDWTHNIEKGMKGDEVKTLQERLLSLGDATIKLDKYGADGIFGPETQAALKAFQKKFGLMETGIYDQATRDAMEQALFPGEHYTEEIQEHEKTITKVGKSLAIVKSIFKGVLSVAKSAFGVISAGLSIVGRVITALSPLATGVLYVAAGLGELITYIFDFTSSLLSSETALNAFDMFLQPIATVINTIGQFLINAGNGITRFVAAMRKATSFKSLGDLLKIDPEKNKYALVLYDIIGKIKSAAEKAGPVFESLRLVIENLFNTVKTWISGKLSSAFQTISEFFANASNAISWGDVLTNVLNGIGTALQVILGIVGGVGYGIFSLGSAFVNGAVALFEFVKNSEFVQSALASITEFTRPIREFFGSVWESITSISGKIGTFKSFQEVWTAFITAMKNNPIGEKFIPIFQKFSDIISKVKVRFEGFFNSVKSAFRMLRIFKDPEKVLNVLKLNPEQNKGAIKIIELMTKIRNAFEWVSGKAKEVKSAIGGLFSKITPGVKSIGKSIKTAIGNFFGGDGTSPGEKISSGFESLKNTIQTKFADFKVWIENFVRNSSFLTSLSNLWKMVGNAIGNFFSTDTSGIEGLPAKILARLQAFDPIIQWIKEKFSNIKDFLMDPKKLLSHVVGALKGVGEFVINIFKNVDIGTIWNTAKTALSTYIMLTFVKSLKNFSESVGVLTGAIDKDESEGFGDKLRSIAVTIAIITAAIAALAFIPADKAYIGIGALTLALAAVVGALVVMNKWATKSKDIGEGILDMSLSIIAVVAAIGLAAAVINTAGDLTKPLLLVGGIIIALGAAAWAMSFFGKKYTGATQGTAKTILAIAAGVYLVVKAIGKMADIIKNNKNKDNRLKKSLGAVAGILVLLGGIAILMSKFGSSGEGDDSTGVASTILAICTTLGAVVSAIGQVAVLIQRYPNEFGGALATVGGIIVALGAVAVLITAFGKGVDPKTLLASAAPIVAMGYFLNMVMSVMGDAIKKIQGVNPKIIEQFLIGVGEAMVALIGTVAVFSAIGIHGLLEAAGGIVVIMTALGIGIDIAATFAADAINKLSSALWLVGSRLGQFSDSVADVNETKIESVMGLLVNTIIPSLVTFVTNSGTIQAASEAAVELWLFGEALNLFKDSISGITENTGAAIKKLPEDIKETVNAINAIEGVKEAGEVLDELGAALDLYYTHLAVTSDAASKGDAVHDENGNFDITAANRVFSDLAQLTIDDDVVAKIQSYAKGGDKDLNSFAHGIINIARALQVYGERISGIDSTQVETANGIIDKIKGLDDHLNPVADVNFEVLNGKRRTIGEFGRDVAALGRALNSYSNSISGLNPGKIFMANIVIDAVSELANKLPTTGGLWQWLTGEQNLGMFATNMGDLGTGMASYAKAVSEASFDNVDAATAAVKGLAEAQSILQTYGGVKSLIEGTAGLDSLGSNLVSLGSSLAAFATAKDGIKTLKDADFKQITKALEPIKGLAEIQSILQRTGGWVENWDGKIDMTAIVAGLDAAFIEKLNKFSEAAKKFDATDEHLDAVLDIMERLALIQSLSQNGSNGYDELGHSFDSLMMFFNQLQRDTENGTALEKLQTNLQSLMGTVSTILDGTASQFETVGQHIDAGIAKGIENEESKALVMASAVAVAQAAFKAACEALGIASPSKAFEWIGEMSVTGFINSLAKGADYVDGASSDVGRSALDALYGAFNGTNAGEAATRAVISLRDSLLSSVSSLFENGENAPVITPVLDLTNIDTGIAAMNGRFSGYSVSVGANLANSVSASRTAALESNGSGEDHSSDIIASIREMGADMMNLTYQMAERMSNLKVVMDSGALVGQIDTKIDKRLGELAKYNRRGM